MSIYVCALVPLLVLAGLRLVHCWILQAPTVYAYVTGFSKCPLVVRMNECMIGHSRRCQSRTRTQRGTLGSEYERPEGACIPGSLGKRGVEHPMEGGRGSGPVLGHFA